MRRVAALALVALLVPSLAGCGASAEHVRNICGDVTQGTTDLPRYDPARPVSALEFALGRFDLVEEAVSKARETSLPGDAAPTLRADWLEPAVASMAPWQATVQAVRDAVDADDPDRIGPALTAALALGTEGVDTAALRAAGYDACATAFTAPTLTDVTA